MNLIDSYWYYIWKYKVIPNLLFINRKLFYELYVQLYNLDLNVVHYNPTVQDYYIYDCLVIQSNINGYHFYEFDDLYNKKVLYGDILIIDKFIYTSHKLDDIHDDSTIPLHRNQITIPVEILNEFNNQLKYELHKKVKL